MVSESETVKGVVPAALAEDNHALRRRVSCWLRTDSGTTPIHYIVRSKIPPSAQNAHAHEGKDPGGKQIERHGQGASRLRV